MDETSGPLLRLTGRQWTGLVLLFALLAIGFTWLLRPLVAPAALAEPEPMVAVAEPMEAPAAVAADPEPAVAVAEAPLPPATPVPFAPDFTGPRIAILLTDVGDDPAQARAAIAALPAAVGLAFTPYPDVRTLARAAKADGHEVIAGLPMQPKSWPRVSPGANTLTVDADGPENVRRLDWALARVEGASGVTGIMGSAFTESETALRPVLAEVGKRNLAYIDARASGRSAGVATARDAGVRAAANNRFLDESGSIAANLAQLEAQAKREGSAIGYARPLPATIAALEKWAPTLEAKGMLLVPPGSLAK
ncbi:divergent polysaccharide deacetylase family protein [Sphingoaurantiacus capsulatus]|uniref:Divergent polysaccharide deacetylase family protein n=1 Tax=Sphingoaurantiacus capsulatus TaxID=1771310 RepID=A0ABV7X999_9SPHN